MTSALDGRLGMRDQVEEGVTQEASGREAETRKIDEFLIVS